MKFRLKLTLLMGARHIGKVIVVHQIVASHVDQLGVRVAQDVLAPLVHRHQREVQLVLGLEHVLLVGDLQQAGRSEGRAVGEEGQWGLLRLAVLAMEDLDPSANVQAQEAARVVQQAAKADGEAALQVECLIRRQGLRQLHAGHVGGQEAVPQQLALQLLAVLRVDQFVHRLVDNVRLGNAQIYIF